jgi:ketosteroid isomerase-like protein
MIVRACWLIAVLASPAAAQTVSPGLELANPEMARTPTHRDVQRRVEEFLHKLGRRDVAGVRGLLAPRALVIVVRQQRDGSFTHTYQTNDEFMAAFEKNAGQPTFEEPLSNVIVTVDSDRLAFVRADFTMVRDRAVQVSGVDQFTLVKEPDGWKIAVLAYTSLPR